MTYRNHIVAIVILVSLCLAVAASLVWFRRPPAGTLPQTRALVEAPAVPAPHPPPRITENRCLGPRGEWHTFPLHMFDETADGEQTIRDALALGRAENKRVLVIWGENLCQFCLFLEDVLASDPACKPLVQSDYVWVRVDLGRGYARGEIKNHDLARSFGLTHLHTPCPNGKTMGAPALCIIDPETGKTVGHLDPQRDLLTGVMGGNDMVAKPMTLQRLFDEKVIHRYLLDHRPPTKQK